MRYSQIIESDQNVLLYRGDSNHVESFNIEQTDPWALFGMGIYLTDNKIVATDYTKKGSDDVVFPKYISGISSGEPRMSQSDLVRGYLKLIIDHELGFKDRIEAIKDELLNEQNIENRTKPDEYWRDREAQRADNAALNAKFKARVAAEFSEYLERAKKIWAQRKKTLTIFKDTTGKYTLNNKKSNASISVFSIPQSYLAKTFDGEAPMPDDALNVMREVLIAFIEKQKRDKPSDDGIHNRKFDMRAHDEHGEEGGANTFDDYIAKYKKNGARYAWRNDTHGGDGQNPSMDMLFNGTHNTVWKEKDHQMYMIQQFQKLGYTGISYQGGVRVGDAKGDSQIRGGGGHLHRAYVIWDGNYLNQHRIDNEIPAVTDIKSIGNKLKPYAFGYT